MKTSPPVALLMRLFKNGMFCVCSVCRPAGSQPWYVPSLKNSATKEQLIAFADWVLREVAK